MREKMWKRESEGIWGTEIEGRINIHWKKWSRISVKGGYEGEWTVRREGEEIQKEEKEWKKSEVREKKKKRERKRRNN